MTPLDSDLLHGAQALGAALVVGLLVGLERGWRERELPDGGRVAGLRTFALIGLLGGVLSVASPDSVLLAALGLAAVALLFAISYPRSSESAGTLSITTAVAALATFGLGVLAARGQMALAIGAAVVVAALLDLKPVLHGWLRLIQPAELNAVLQLGVLTAVVLPLLPDTGYGPYLALNPYRLWLAVILIAALSLLGHLASRLRGARQGLLWTGLLGGMASSTAATLALARSVRSEPALVEAAAAGILGACGVMFLRMALVVAALQPALALALGGVLLPLAVACFAAAALMWRRQQAGAQSIQPQTRLFDLPTAIGFGLVLGIVAVLARAAHEALGVGGIYTVAFLSGLADVDAMVISSAQMLAQDEVTATVATVAILLATVANMLAKATMAWSIGGRALGRWVAGGYLAVAVVGMAATLAVRMIQ